MEDTLSAFMALGMGALLRLICVIVRYFQLIFYASQVVQFISPMYDGRPLKTAL